MSIEEYRSVYLNKFSWDMVQSCNQHTEENVASSQHPRNPLVLPLYYFPPKKPLSRSITIN